MGMTTKIEVIIFSTIVLSAASAYAMEAGNPASIAASATETARWQCLESRPGGNRGGMAVSGFMPGRLEQEAICLTESGSPQVPEEGVNWADPQTAEIRKLRLMESICKRHEKSPQELSAIFSGTQVKNPPRKYLGISPGTKLEQIPAMDTSGTRERVPDLLRTLDNEKAPWIYWYRRSDERLAALCIDPREDGSCGKILPKNKSDEGNKKNLNGEEEGKFKSFMKKVKSSFSGPEPKEISLWKNVDFYGVRLSEAAYAFDYDLSYIGFFARIAEREPFASKRSPQYIRDVFKALIRQFGEPTLKFKEPSGDRPGITDSHGIWITTDGMRIDAACNISEQEGGICANGRLSVRRLPLLNQPTGDNGARFFE